MGRKYFVLFSLTKNYYPRVYKTRTTIRKYLQEIPYLQYKEFDTEEEANTFVQFHLKILKEEGRSEPAQQKKVTKSDELKTSGGKEQQTGQAEQLSIQEKESESSSFLRSTKAVVEEPTTSSNVPNPQEPTMIRQQETTKKDLPHERLRTQKSTQGLPQTSARVQHENSSTQNPIDLKVKGFEKQPESSIVHVVKSRLERSSIPQFLLNYTKSNPLSPFDPSLMADLRATSYMRQNPGLCSIHYTLMQTQVPIISREYILGQKYKLEGQLLALAYGLWDAHLNNFKRLTLLMESDDLSRLIPQNSHRTIDPKIRSLRKLLAELSGGFDQVQYKLENDGSIATPQVGTTN